MPLQHLREVLNQYHPLSDQAWLAYKACCKVKSVKKGEVIYAIGAVPTSFAFLHQGLVRAYVLDEQGNEYNKNFFAQGRFPGCMTALLKNEPSWLAVQALEDCQLVEIDHSAYRQAMLNNADLMQFHINYLETHWLLEKEPKEIGFLQFEAKERYLKFLADFADILPRLAQYHVASYLGITATQLSRIKKACQIKKS